MFIYLGIFFFKIMGDALATLRIILVANGKKVLGAILQFIIALLWVIVTGSVIIDVKDDPLKVLFFAMGSLVGSFLGSILEEKLALGDNLLLIKSNNIMDIKKYLNYDYYFINDKVMGILIKRKKRNIIINKIKKIDDGAYVIAQKIKTIP